MNTVIQLISQQYISTSLGRVDLGKDVIQTYLKFETNDRMNLDTLLQQQQSWLSKWSRKSGCKRTPIPLSCRSNQTKMIYKNDWQQLRTTQKSKSAKRKEKLLTQAQVWWRTTAHQKYMMLKSQQSNVSNAWRTTSVSLFKGRKLSKKWTQSSIYSGRYWMPPHRRDTCPWVTFSLSLRSSIRVLADSQFPVSKCRKMDEKRSQMTICFLLWPSASSGTETNARELACHCKQSLLLSTAAFKTRTLQERCAVGHVYYISHVITKVENG